VFDGAEKVRKLVNCDLPDPFGVLGPHQVMTGDGIRLASKKVSLNLILPPLSAILLVPVASAAARNCATNTHVRYTGISCLAVCIMPISIANHQSEIKRVR
jgi:hypothetical protein